MKSIAELEAIRQKTLERVGYRKEADNDIRIVVGMATCGIAAGARPVMLAFMDEMKKRNLGNVTVSQTGCIGMCEQEVLVDIVKTDQPRISYGKVTADFVPTLISEHVVNGRIVEERVIGKITK